MVEQINEALNTYRQQQADIIKGLEQLDKTYAQQRELGVNTYNQLAGAISALETLLTPPAPEVPAPTPGAPATSVEQTKE
jgi:hypothetical protein